jgi:beta-phosphoglucomutase
MILKAVLFDLDGVLTDTAEYHYLAWKKLAEAEGFPFSREANEKLRGVSRRESLQLILAGRQVDEATMQSMMDRKNGYYQEMLAQVSPQDLLPGVIRLLDELDAAGIPYGLASASRNAASVVAQLGIAHRLAVVADGHSVERPKPAPDLFRYGAAMLNVPPGECLVVEDAAAGIVAAVSAGMPALALGPAERFETLLHQHNRVQRRDSLANVSLADLAQILQPDETWLVIQPDFDPAQQHHMETVFTLGSGYFASRGSFEEGYPGERPLTLAHGIFDDMPVSVTELANLPNWLSLTLTVDGQTFRLDQGTLLYFRRSLNLYQGVLQRQVRWQSPTGVILDLTFERFVSYAQEQVGALRVLVTAVNQPCQLRFTSGINGHVANDDLLHWHHQGQGQTNETIWLHSQTRHSGIQLGTAASVAVTGEGAIAGQHCDGQPGFVVERPLTPGQTVQFDKLVAYAADRDAVDQAADVIGRAITLLDDAAYDEVKAAHVAAWARLWDDCDVVIEGDAEAQLAVRFNLFQLLVAAPQHDERVSIGAKTLSGLGYRGHVFWDTEIFILPFFSYVRPKIARNMLMYRYHTLAGARRKAAGNGYRGAQFAWESAVTGDEVTPRWVPDFEGKELVRIWTGDIEIHISADIAYAIMQYWQVTGDDAFLRDYGAEIILDSARFWGDRAEPEEVDGQRRYAFRDVIGPDEYHDHVDNNTYTNRMAQWHLQTAVALLDWLQNNYPAKALQLIADLDLNDDTLAHWQDVIAHVIIYHDAETGLMHQFEGFFQRKTVDLEFIRSARKSLQVVLGIEGANASQVIKQADVIMLLCLLRDEYDRKTWQTNWDTYMPLTDHRYGSSLGPSFHAWAACEIGRFDEAYEHFMLAARADLRNPRGNAEDGIHAASAGGVWQALAFGFAGLRLGENGFSTTPRLPSHWRRLSFKFYFRGQQHIVDIRA